MDDRLTMLLESEFEIHSDYGGGIFKISCSPLTMIHKNQDHVHTIGYDEDYNIVSIEERKPGDAVKEYTPKEIENMTGYGILTGRYQHYDPRYFIKQCPHDEDIRSFVLHEEPMLSTLKIAVFNEDFTGFDNKVIIGENELQEQRTFNRIEVRG